MARIALLPTRYGLTPERVGRRIDLMSEALAKQDLTPTIHVTASNLEAHPSFVGHLQNVDVGLHGYRHLAYSALSPLGQAQDLDASRETLERHGIKTSGFRAPYLRANQTTFQLLAERGLSYDSSLPEQIPISPPSLAARVARAVSRRYAQVLEPPGSSRPDGHLVELPVALPDDEILVDGLGIRNPTQLNRIFEVMVRAAAEAGSFLVLQVHPERYSYFADGISGALRVAEDLDAWKTSLSAAADWVRAHPLTSHKWPHGSSFAIAITGDLDALALLDFARHFRRHLE